MDTRTFDELSRMLARPVTRRGVLAALLAAIAGGSVARESADAKIACRTIGQSCGAIERCCSRLVCHADRCTGRLGARGCTDDADCYGEYVCVDGQCLQPRKLGQSCEHSEECDAGLICIESEHKCRRGEGARCKSSAQCGSGLICIDRVCRRIQPGMCLRNGDCNYGERCYRRSVCRCGTNAGCRPGETCENGHCRCGHSEPCVNGEECVEHACRPIGA